MRELVIIDQREVLGKDFKIYGDFENPLFLAKDVAGWIDYNLSNVHQLVGMVDESEKVRDIVTTHGGNQEAWFLTEDGLYEVLMQSRKPIAKQFKRQVKEILKTIRKTGGFISVTESDDESTIMAKALIIANNTIERLKLESVENRPKVLFADAVSISDGTILIGELAKILKGNGVDIGQNRLFDRLRRDGFLIKRKGSDYNAPTQRAMELGLFKVKETAISHSDGHVTISKTTKITGKGQIYFTNLFLARGAESQV